MLIRSSLEPCPQTFSSPWSHSCSHSSTLASSIHTGSSTTMSFKMVYSGKKAATINLYALFLRGMCKHSLAFALPHEILITKGKEVGHKSVLFMFCFNIFFAKKIIFDLKDSSLGFSFQGSQPPWKSLKIAVGAGKSLNVGTNFIQPSKHRPSGKNRSCCGRTKKNRLKALFCTEWSPWKMGNVSLKVLEKSLNFFVQKRVRTPSFKVGVL